MSTQLAGTPVSTLAFSPRFEWRFLSRFVLRSPGFPFSTLEGLRCHDSYRAARAAEWNDHAPMAASHPARAAFEAEAAQGRTALLALAVDPAVQEALYMSSPDFLENNLGKYVRLASAGRLNSDVRRIERHLFSYVQRLVAKNETTSTFGPLNYGVFAQTDQPQACELAYADGALVQRREVFLSFWAVRALAQAVSQDADLAPDQPLRFHPMTQFVPGLGLKLHQSGKTLRLGLSLCELMARIDGSCSARELAGLCPPDERAAFDRLLAALLDKGCVLRGPFVSSSELRLLERLLGDVAELPASPSQRHWLDRLDAWRQWCTAMSEAPFETRLPLIQQAEARFTRETGLAPRRGQGEMYADRTIFYEEALGNVQRFGFSRTAHDALSRRLRGALELCAATGHHEWTQLRALGAAFFRELSPEGRAVPLADFIAAVNAKFTEFPSIPPAPVVDRLREEVRRQMAQGTTREVNIDASRLGIPEVEHALYSLPDMFFSAASEEALTDGSFDVFLGKLHHHMLLPSWLTTFMDDDAGLRAELSHLLAEPGLRQLVGLEVMRRNKGFYAFAGPRITYAEAPSADVQEERVPMHELEVVLDSDGGLALRGPGRSGLFLYLTLADHARYLPFALLTWPWLAQVSVETGAHTPRVLVDGVVIQRERWLLSAQEIVATRGADEFASFMRLAQWCASLGLPQQVYVKGAQRKPVFIDLAIPQCHALLRSLAEGADTLRAEEMYPAPDGLWLNQAKGGFTCELRANVFKLPTPSTEPSL